MKTNRKHLITYALTPWAIACFVFLQWYYLYHLVFRLQNQLFLYSSEYLSSYFQEPAWLARLTGDFLTQLFYFNYSGALTNTLTLLFYGSLISCTLGKLFVKRKWCQVLLVLLIITWEFLRNCDINYELSSTISLIGALCIFLLYAMLSSKWRWSGLVFIPLTYWLVGYGVWLFLLFAILYNVKKRYYALASTLILVSIATPALLRQTYHLTWEQAYKYPTTTFFSKPDFFIEKVLALSIESSSGNWNKVVTLTEKSRLESTISSYFYNLSHGIQGTLPDQLTNAYQPGPLALLIQLNPQTTRLSIWNSSEAWFQLGDMTMSEHSALLSQIFSPNHRSSSMLMRLAEINMINGDTAATMKYLGLLKKTWLYKNWAQQRWPGKETPKVREWLDYKRTLIPTQDTLRVSLDCQRSLRTLVNANSKNRMALDYLLCYDLLAKDIKAFMADYDLYMKDNIPNRLYSEALVVGLMDRKASLEEIKHYYIRQITMDDFKNYTSQYALSNGNEEHMKQHFGKTYWYYCHFNKFN
jgi:hypothetical protein